MARADEKRSRLRERRRGRADPSRLRGLPAPGGRHQWRGADCEGPGGKADPRKLARLARVYESSSVRRLGYLLELVRHARQAKALEPFAREAKSLKPLDRAARPLVVALASAQEKSAKWMLLINERVEVEA
jgi:hypothetical protein